MHADVTGPEFGYDSPHLIFLSIRRHIIHYACSCFQRGPGHRRLHCINRKRDIEPTRQLFYNRQYSPQFLLFGNKCRTRTRGFAADIQYLCSALFRKPERVRNRRARSSCKSLPPSENESGVMLTMPMTSA